MMRGILHTEFDTELGTEIIFLPLREESFGNLEAEYSVLSIINSRMMRVLNKISSTARVSSTSISFCSIVRQ